MDQKKIDFRPGVVKDDSPLASEGTYSDSNWIRSRRGRPENVKGFAKYIPTQFTGKARGVKAWSTLDGVPWFAFGTSSKLYAVRDTALIDITPRRAEGSLDNPFKTTSGSPIVKVRHYGHGLKAGQSITFSNAMPSGGITINGAYTVTTVLSNDYYTITHSANASSTNDYPAPDPLDPPEDQVWPNYTPVSAGGRVDYVVPFVAGAENGSSSTPATTWDLDNIGEVLFANRTGDPIYMFQPAPNYNEILIDTGFTSIGSTGTTSWATGGTAWTSQSGGVARFVRVSGNNPSNLSQNIQGKCKPGYVYEFSVQVSTFTGPGEFDLRTSLKIRINAGDPVPSLIEVGSASLPITKAGTYSMLFVCPDNPIDIVITGRAGEDTTQVNLTAPSLKLLGRATYISQAPQTVDHMFASPHGDQPRVHRAVVVLPRCAGFWRGEHGMLPRLCL
ncbi:hypothetical protein [Chelatococcus sp. YT9]|uniref:hypothetical protein n=1 Tax=Chelatococcus sp. YT9 TaxID=2835635 RepID=UPI001BD092FB|nr:hypothetical protein [Chelatococcus sp. YT9]MBS7698599.1 hypothetical protein [Chelatococcus sp. YT9]